MFFGGRKILNYLIKQAEGLKYFFKKKRSVLAVVLFFLIIFPLGCKLSYSFIEACSKPEYSWDAAGNWTVAGKNYFYADNYRSDKVLFELKNTVNGYPRALSLMHYWLFSWMGEANDQWSKIIFPLELLCFLAVFYSGLKPTRGRWGALAFIWLATSAPIFLYHSTIGYADLTKTVYFAVGFIGFYRWLQTKQENYFVFFSLCLALTTWVKMEGKVLYAIGLLVLLTYLWREHRSELKKKIKYIGTYLFSFLIIGLPWQLFIMINHLPDPQAAVYLRLDKVIEFHQRMYSLLFLQGSWGVFWLMAFAALVFCFKKQLSGENFYLALAMFLFYGNLLFIYLFFRMAVDEMTLTFNRVVLPLYVLTVFDLGCILPKLRINKEIEL